MLIAKENLREVLLENVSEYVDFDQSFMDLLNDRFMSKYQVELQAVADALFDLYPLETTDTHWTDLLWLGLEIEDNHLVFFIDHFPQHDHANVDENLLQLHVNSC